MPPDSSSTLKEIIEWTFAPLDTSQHINTGLLMEKGLMDSSLLWYRGSQNDSIIYNNMWYQLYFSSYNAQVNGNNSLLPIDSVYSLIGSYESDGKIPVMGMSIDYNYLSSFALDSNWIDTSDGQIFITQGQNPFLQDSIFAFAPSTHHHTIFTDTLKLVFPQELFFTNKGDAVATIQIKVDDGEWEVLPENGIFWIFDGPITVGNYRDFNLDVKVTLNNGFILNSNFRIGVERADKYEAIIPLETLTADITIVGSTPARGLATIIFGKNGSGVKNTCISKPLIIVEGIDFGTETAPTGCVNGKCGSLGFVDIQYGNNPNYPELAMGPQFVSALVDDGYDIFYLDFEDGATYMENNAMVLVKLINHINQNKCTNEEIVVLGVSMGGQVAKYGLSYMEHHQMHHCVRTYVSFDSPHKGANIPLGTQHLVDFLKDEDSKQKFIYNNLLRPATKQLLLVHFDSGEKDALFESFQQNLSNVGNYPQITRNVSIVNGSRTGQDMGFNSGDTMMDWHWAIKILWGAVTLRRVEIDLYALCGDDDDYIFKANASGIGEKKEKAPSNCVPTDHVPGGFRTDISDGSGPQRTSLLWGLTSMSIGTINAHVDHECFVPTISGLDINTTDYFYDIDENLFRNDIPFPSIYPFQAYYAPDDNEKHVTISSDNIAWLVAELEKNHVGLGNNLVTTYNFGESLKDRLPTVNVGNGGILQVNGNYATGYGTGPVPNVGSDKEVFSTSCGFNVAVTVSSGGEFILGDINENTGIVYMGIGSKIILQSGSILRIHNGSKLVIEEGAELVVYDGALIYLEGENTSIDIHGKLRLHSNAALSFSKGSASKVGFLHFVRPSGLAGSQIIAQGSNSTINLQGDGKDNLLLKVEGGQLEIPHPNSAQSFHVSGFYVTDGLIEIGTNSSLLCGSAIAYNNVRTKGSASSVSNTGLTLLGQLIHSFIDSDFREVSLGMEILNNYSDNMTIEEVLFKNCTVGLLVNESSIDMNNCMFYENESGLELYSPSFQSTISNSQFFFNTNYGILQSGSQLLHITEAIFYYNNTGIDFHSVFPTGSPGGSLVLECAKFYLNVFGVKAGPSTIVNMSRAVSTSSLYGGDNSFWMNGTSVFLNGSQYNLCEIYLEDGENNFVGETSTSSGNNPYNFITGFIDNSILNTNGRIEAVNNYWHPSPGSDIISGGSDYFDVKTYFMGFNPVAVDLEGLVLSNANTLCYEDPEELYWAVPDFHIPDEGIKEEKYNVNIFPNPTNDMINIVVGIEDDERNPVNGNNANNSTTPDIISVGIYSVHGQSVGTASYDNGKWLIEARTLADGIYYVRITTHRTTITRQVRVLK